MMIVLSVEVGRSAEEDGGRRKTRTTASLGRLAGLQRRWCSGEEMFFAQLSAGTMLTARGPDQKKSTSMTSIFSSASSAVSYGSMSTGVSDSATSVGS